MTTTILYRDICIKLQHIVLIHAFVRFNIFNIDTLSMLRWIPISSAQSDNSVPFSTEPLAFDFWRYSRSSLVGTR